MRWLTLPVLLAASCGRPEPVRPNLVLVTIDTLRADHCSAYGYARPTTPTFDGLARQGALVKAAYAPMANTAPSHATLFTSLYPLSHGLIRNGMVLPAARLTLTEILHASGYHTSAVVSSFVLKRRFGFAQGFGSFDGQFDRAHETLPLREWEGHRVQHGFDRRADATTDLALDWLARRHRDRPFFLWVHYFDPHDPYVPPAPWDRRFRLAGGSDLQNTVSAYDGEVAFTDSELARLLRSLDAEGIADRTLVVVTADHGEGLMQHGLMRHGVQLYEEAVRVPLVFRWPGVIPAGLRIPGPVEMVDVAPTILRLLGFDPPPVMEGRSLAPALRGERRGAGYDAHRMVFLQRRKYDVPYVSNFHVVGKEFGVRAGRWKYIEAREEGRRELYDLQTDAGEMRNLASERPAIVRGLSNAIARWREKLPRAGAIRDDDSAETLEALRSLGYVK